MLLPFRRVLEVTTVVRDVDWESERERDGVAVGVGVCEDWAAARTASSARETSRRGHIVVVRAKLGGGNDGLP